MFVLPTLVPGREERSGSVNGTHTEVTVLPLRKSQILMKLLIEMVSYNDLLVTGA